MHEALRNAAAICRVCIPRAVAAPSS